MKLTVNNQPHELAGGATLGQLIATLGVDGRKGLAVALNASVVPVSKWAQTPLSDGDAVLLIQATQGG